MRVLLICIGTCEVILSLKNSIVVGLCSIACNMVIHIMCIIIYVQDEVNVGMGPTLPKN